MKISSGKYHNAVTMTDGTVYTAGSNSSGQLGIFGIGDNINYDNVPSFTPISVPDGKTVQKIVCGEQHTCIIMTDGSLYGAGSNYNGELGLGLGGPNQSAIFVQIPIPDGKTVKDVNCGALHTVIITTDGYLYGAGLNYSGQLGLGNYTESITTFTRINVYDEKVPNIVGCGSNSTIVQMTDGSVYGTGGNGYGQLGQGDLANRNRLTLIPLPSGKRAKGVVSGEGHTVIPMTDGTIYGCGQNGYYQLTSNYNSNNVLIQMPTPSGKTIKSIIGNDQRTTILMTDGTIYFTGNKYNQYRLQFTQINQFSNIQYLSESFQLIWASGINQPYALVAYGSYMYVGRRGAGSGIDRYELSDGSLDTENWVNGGASNMFNIASMAVDGSYLYAVASATPENPPEDPTNIFKISLTDASIVSNNWAPGVNLVGTIAIYGAFMYAVHYSDGAIHKLSLVDGSVVSENFATIDLVGDTNNTIMNIDDAGTYLYVQRGLGRISKISLLDGMVVNTNWINIPPQAPLNYQLDVFGLHGPSTYAINNDNGKIVQINVLSRRITNASYAASTVWTNETSVISAITVFGSSLYAARADTGTIDKFALPAISNICFPASAPVQTDQGIVTIARLDPMLHTIEGMRIVDVTKTVTNDSFLVRIGRDALGKDYPVQDTVISRLHKIEYGGRMVAAEWFVGQIAGVEEIPYSGEPLYNVILAEPRTMRVNNLVCETLLPNNPIAKLYARSSRYTEYTRDIILSLLKTHTASNNHEAYRRVLSSL
jgi:alpha-tubulin suppressor-like RCC1 family protein